MLKNRFFLLLSLSLFTSVLSAEGVDPNPYPGQDQVFPFANAAGQSGSTAVAMDDSSIVAWASAFVNMVYGNSVAAQWKNPVKALGPAIGDSFDVVSLGAGGEITMTFTHAIRNGQGADFAVFENSFSDIFLELAWVEVSTDGVHFVRFPNYSYHVKGEPVTADLFHGLAGKYRQGYGTPFDLDQLRLAYDALAVEDLNEPFFSSEFRDQLERNYPFLELDNIRYVRLVDVIGDGTALDTYGFPIIDPYPTTGSAGFDLEAVAVLNQVEPTGSFQSISFAPLANRKLLEGDLVLNASASSGLPVSYEVLAGPATVADNVLTFTGLGQIVVKAVQPGDDAYAIAAPVTRSFYVADALQHIYFEPVANQLVGTTVPLHAQTSSGLTPIIEVVAGAQDVSAGFPPSQALSSGTSTGSVQLRAYQVGGTVAGVTYAPADDVFTTIEVVNSGAPTGPLSFAQWQTNHSISGAATLDSDTDGASDFEEYAAGTDPNDAGDTPVRTFRQTTDGAFQLGLTVNTSAPIRLIFQGNQDLSNSAGWAEFVPEQISHQLSLERSGQRELLFKLSPDYSKSGFWRIQLKENN